MIVKLVDSNILTVSTTPPTLAKKICCTNADVWSVCSS